MDIERRISSVSFDFTIVAKMYVRGAEGDPRSMTAPAVDPFKAAAQQRDARGEKNHRSKLLPR